MLILTNAFDGDLRTFDQRAVRESLARCTALAASSAQRQKLSSNDAILSSIINKRETKETDSIYAKVTQYAHRGSRGYLRRVENFLPSPFLATRDGWYFSTRTVTRSLSLRFFFFFFSPSPGPLPHRIQPGTNQRPSLTSILLALTCEPVTRGNLKGERTRRTEIVTSRG